MDSNRRDFFLGSSLYLAGALELLNLTPEEAFAQSPPSQSQLTADRAALDFWTRGMGLPPSAIPSAEATRGGNSGFEEDFGREPIFLHYDEDAKALITVDQIDQKKLMPSGDAQVDMQLQRLRMSEQDHAQYTKYTSGAIYLEMQQKAAAAAAGASGEDRFIQLASTAFSAFTAGTGKGKPKPTTTAATPAAPPKPKAGAVPNAAGASHFFQGKGSPAKAGTPIQLQTPSQAQSLPLPKGAGKVAFSAFVKDPRKNAFGTFMDAMIAPDKSGSPAFAALLSLPMTAVPALAAVRAVVGNLQLHGSNQQTIMKSAPIDMAATTAACSSAVKPYLPLRTGTYIVIRREHGPLIAKSLSDFKIMDGYLVPKDVTDTLYVTPDLVTSQIPGLTYLSLGVNVKPTKFNACSNSPEA
jgi:hypothetical protein